MKHLLIVLLLLLPPAQTAQAQRHADTELLGRALDYFTAGKYHEALLLFQPLDKSYKLNARFRAYIGLCYYYEWDYQNAVKYLDEMLPKLDALSPQERSVYCYADAESHFNLQQYDAAIPYYEGVLLNGFERDKGDAYYRLGFCYYLLGEQADSRGDLLAADGLRANALDHLQAADAYYRKYRNTSELEARLAQIKRMTEGLKGLVGR